MSSVARNRPQLIAISIEKNNSPCARRRNYAADIRVGVEHAEGRTAPTADASAATVQPVMPDSSRAALQAQKAHAGMMRTRLAYPKKKFSAKLTISMMMAPLIVQ